MTLSDLPRQYAVLRIYLERSRNDSLHISLVYDHEAEKHHLLDLLIVHVHHWYAAHL